MYGISEHHELQCLMRVWENYQECDNPLKSNGNLVYRDDDSNNQIIIAMLSEFLLISDMKNG